MSRKRRSRVAASGQGAWKRSLSHWIEGVGMGGHPTFAHEEYGNLYQIEPIDPTGNTYACQYTGGRAGLTVKYLAANGDVSSSIVLFRGPAALTTARLAAVRHYERFRASTRAKDAFAGVFRSNFRRV